MKWNGTEDLLSIFLDADDPKKDIKLFINSTGGSVTAGMGIYDAMKLCKADIAAGTKGKRYCMPNSRVMIHLPLRGGGGKAKDKEEKQQEFQTQQEFITSVEQSINIITTVREKICSLPRSQPPQLSTSSFSWVISSYTHKKPLLKSLETNISLASVPPPKPPDLLIVHYEHSPPTSLSKPLEPLDLKSMSETISSLADFLIAQSQPLAPPSSSTSLLINSRSPESAYGRNELFAVTKFPVTLHVSRT
ncbi:hypothetical protein TSUD_323460 [Trifolium subterraneum]|uniref:ATP-dependent Clp protease proteolytic subunit n=1 Tax=Trifolium subterraneum TaxID=3900 RepID=A0A2Z6NS28_TRISU|nr:hypothetical protein TSUD_323460 [Trifolium subterraneum]